MKFSVEFTTNDKKSIVRALDGRNNIASMLSDVLHHYKKLSLKNAIISFKIKNGKNVHFLRVKKR